MVVFHVFLIVHVIVNRVKHHIWCNLVDIQRVRWLHFIQGPTNNHMTCARLTIETLEQAVDMFKIYNKGSKEAPMASLCFYYQLWIYFTPRSVSIVGFGRMDGGWIGPWFERPYGRRNSWSGVGYRRGGVPSAWWGGAWCCNAPLWTISLGCWCSIVDVWRGSECWGRGSWPFLTALLHFIGSREWLCGRGSVWALGLRGWIRGLVTEFWWILVMTFEFLEYRHLFILWLHLLACGDNLIVHLLSTFFWHTRAFLKHVPKTTFFSRTDVTRGI